MKNYFLKIFILICINFSAFAQDRGKSQIEVSYGLLSSEELAYDLANIIVDLFLWDNPYTIRRTGCVFITYKYFELEKLALGGSAGFNKHGRTDYYRNGTFSSYDNKTFTISGEVNFYYLKRANVSLYTMGGLGYFNTNSTTNYTSKGSTQETISGVAMQFTPIGIRYGKSFGGFAEIGVGYKGVINFGVNVKF